MIKAIKRLVFRSISLESYLRLMQRGYFFLYGTGLLRPFGSFALHYYVKKLIRKGDTVIDIGANLGYYSILFARWTGSEGRVLAVEPIRLYNKIFNEKARRHPNITLYPCALGEEEGNIWMVTTAGQGGYLRTGLPHVWDPDKDGPLEEIEFRFEAQMKRPSDLFGNLDRIDYIKCDIEGYEYHVLSRMSDIIAKHRPKIQVEVWGRNERNIDELLTGLGYRPFKLSGGRLAPGNSAGGDYIFIHNSDPCAPR